MSSSKRDATSICLIEKVFEDTLAADSLVWFRPEGGQDTFCSGIHLYSPHVKKSVGKCVKITFLLHVASMKSLRKEEKTAEWKGGMHLSVTGQVSGIDDGSFFVSSIFNLEVQPEDDSDGRGIKKGDWIEARGELLCEWDEADIVS